MYAYRSVNMHADIFKYKYKYHEVEVNVDVHVCVYVLYILMRLHQNQISAFKTCL